MFKSTAVFGLLDKTRNVSIKSRIKSTTPSNTTLAPIEGPLATVEGLAGMRAVIEQRGNSAKEIHVKRATQIKCSDRSPS